MKKIFTTKVVLGALFVLFTTFTSVQVFAQSTTAAISGTVLDEKGEGLPGANVIAIHEPTGSRYGAASRADGRFNIVNMRVGGPYKVTISFVGYKDVVKTGINLTIAQDLRINSKLEVAESQLEEVKVVAARSSVINSGRTGAATTVSNKQVTTLPTLNRSLTDFARLDPRSSGGLSFAGRNSAYNNISVDGALFNNTFGLSGTIGGQASAQPISVDAIDQFQVNLAPFDVRLGMSTGANINVVTKSGTNEWSGSVYSFNRSQDITGTKLGSLDLTDPITGKLPISFNTNTTQIGGRIGGALIKNKVFFFASYEQETKTDPGTSFKPTVDGVANDNTTSAAKAADLDKLKAFLIQKYSFDPGAYSGYDRLSKSTKFNARLDWNISDKHKLAIKYNTLRSFSDQPPSGRAPSNTVIPFQSAFYRINNNLDSYIAELNSTFGGKIANNLIVNYTQLRDFRETPYLATNFPLVDIRNGVAGSTTVSTSFGYEPFTAFNVLDSDVLSIADNLTIYAGKNVLTFGVAYEDNTFKNGFAPDYNTGYVFQSYDDFYKSANDGVANAQQFRQRWTNTPDFPFARLKGNTVSLYGQNEMNLAKGFKLTVGLRADGTSIPVEVNSTTTNTFVPGLTFRDGLKVATDKFPDFTVLWSPRVGFNWDVNEEKKTQVRGGLGIFSGRVPYVWLSNQLSNNGVLFGSESTTANGVANRAFNPSVDKYRPAVDFGAVVRPTQYNLNITDPNFKFPQIFRANLAVDQNLGDGWLATFEGAYTKDINGINTENINLPRSTVSAIGADNRPIYYNVGANTFPSTKYNRIYGLVAAGGTTTPANLSATAPDISDAILIKNTSNGYSYFLTGTIAKSFESGLFASLSYTYTDSRSVNDGGTTAIGIWSGRQVSGDPNADVTSYSNFLQRHRIIANGSYKLNYANDRMATTFGFTYSVGPAGRYSYVYNGDMNGDAQTSNDLMYIPRDQSEILLRAIGTYTAAQQWNDLDNYIKQDPYLSTRRGQYAERNGAEQPWQASFDFKVIQDFNFKIGGKVNTLQLTFDIFNAGNYVTSNWGIGQIPLKANPLSFAGYDNATGFVATGSVPTGKPVFTFPFRTGTTPLADSFQNSPSNFSRWQGQVGIRYIFN
jgi:outer membrane receptor protein involved in Fe transport